MNVNVSRKEQQLIENARKLSENQLDTLLGFLETVVNRQQAGDEFYKLSNQVSSSAQKKGLTFELLQDILKEADANRA